MGKQVSFDLISKSLYRLLDRSEFLSEFLQLFQYIDKKVFVSITSAFIASVLASVCSQPGDMILTETYKSGSVVDCHKASDCNSDNRDAISRSSSHAVPSALVQPKRSFAKVVGDIYSDRGIAGFFIGLQARLMHVVAIITIQLTLYDIIKTMLGLPTSGAGH
jgi:solute carrier family 25 phosphate transporter 3